ncbi:MAG: 2-phospho-L-lactate/phosphoenolpyruvate guanylyltransferase [Thermoleophilaceae bacterium]|nr:2-phospho-L-lactate/phosphoenolpyruvate guanylyltransferase [Thermoleophilaceae bacterium]
MTTFAILPVKRFAEAKQRLDLELSAGTRRALAEAMVTDVLVALRRAEQVDTVLVVTDEPGAQALAYGYGAEVVQEDGNTGHSSAALLGIDEAVVREATRVLLVPGDCPALDPKEVDALLEGSHGSEIVVVPDRHGTGTNALVLSPPDAMRPAFGPGSRERHVQRAQESGAQCRVEEVPTLMLDVDTREDLEALRDVLASATGGAAHTRGMLNRLSRR